MTIPAPTTTTAAPIATFCHIFIRVGSFVTTACLPALEGNHPGNTGKHEIVSLLTTHYALGGPNVSPGRPEGQPETYERSRTKFQYLTHKERRHSVPDSNARTEPSILETIS